MCLLIIVFLVKYQLKITVHFYWIYLSIIELYSLLPYVFICYSSPSWVSKKGSNKGGYSQFQDVV